MPGYAESHIRQRLSFIVCSFNGYTYKRYDILPIVSRMSNSLLAEFEDFRYENVRTLIAEWGGDIEKNRENLYCTRE